MSETPQTVDVAELGKQGDEHYEFNRGVLIALQRTGRRVRVHGSADLFRVQAQGLSGVEPGILLSTTAGSRSTQFKLQAAALALRLALRGGRTPLLVLYACPLAHLVLALAAWLRRRPLVVFLHGEIEFLADVSRTQKRIGERLMSSALGCAPKRMHYLCLTRNAATALPVRRAGVGTCVHPISRTALQGEAVMPVLSGGGGLLLFRRPLAAGVVERLEGASAGTGLRWNINHQACALRVADGAQLWRHLDHEPRPHLSRETLERALAEADGLLLTADEHEYQFTASGLACAAAALGTPVMGVANPFMVEYAARYPVHFFTVPPQQEGLSALPRPGPLDNLHEVMERLAGALELDRAPSR
jgi:hypothetical protein